MSDSFDKFSEEDRASLRDMLKHVKPIRQDKHPLPLKKTRKKTLPASSPNREMETFFPPIDFTPRSWTEQEEQLHFAKGGISHRIQTQLKRGKMPIEATVDLHQMTVAEALSYTQFFIQQAIVTHKRCIRIIHGKGHYSTNSKPILKSALNEWLRDHPEVLAFESAQPKQGGSGALYVLLKRFMSCSNSGKAQGLL